MTVFIAFDILDLDGSSLQGRMGGTALAVEMAGGEAERLLHSLPPALSSDWDAAFLRLYPTLGSFLPSLLASTIPHQPRRSLFRPRGDINRTDFSGTPGASDPA
jgi:hypothetical protein